MIRNEKKRERKEKKEEKKREQKIVLFSVTKLLVTIQRIYLHVHCFQKVMSQPIKINVAGQSRLIS